MSLRSLVNALEAEGLTATEKLVLISYANHDGGDGWVWPSQGTVAKLVGCSRESVNRATGKLVEMGYITRESRLRPNGSKTSNAIRLQPIIRGCDKKSHTLLDPCDETSHTVVTKNHNPSDDRSHPESPIESPNKESTPLTPQGGELALEVLEESKNPLQPNKKKGKKEWIPNETQSLLNSLFRRRPTTRWSPKELRAYAAIDFTREDLEAVKAYYSAPSTAFERDWRRRDLITLLNNWPGEVDRADQFKRGEYKPKPKGRPEPVTRVVDTTPKKRRNWDDPEIKPKMT